jgi:maleate isomerase
MEQLVLKAKIGLVVVSASTISEMRYPLAAPPGVGFFASRMLLSEDQGLQGLVEMEKSSERAVQELASANVDSIAYCCTASGALRGLGRDRGFCTDMEEQWGVPTTSTMLAAVEALQYLGINRVVVTSPYPDSHHEPEEAYLAEAGITAVSMTGMGFHTAAEFAAVSPDEIFRFSMAAWERRPDDADGMFVSCMNFDAMGAVQVLEHAIAKPVVTSHTATLWRALSLAGVADPVPGYGRLLAEERAIRNQGSDTRKERR